MSNDDETESVSMELELLPYLATNEFAYVYNYEGFWQSIKNAGSVLYCNAEKLAAYEQQEYDFKVIQPVRIDPTAKISPNATVYIR